MLRTENTDDLVTDLVTPGHPRRSTRLQINKGGSAPCRRNTRTTKGRPNSIVDSGVCLRFRDDHPIHFCPGALSPGSVNRVTEPFARLTRFTDGALISRSVIWEFQTTAGEPGPGRHRSRAVTKFPFCVVGKHGKPFLAQSDRSSWRSGISMVP